VIFVLLKNLGKILNHLIKKRQRFVFSGTIEDTELIDGLVLDQKTIGFGAPTRIEKAKIALIQFCISPPKTDVNIKKIFIFLFFCFSVS